MCIQKPPSRYPILRNLAAARVAPAAHFDLRAHNIRWKVALHLSGARIVPPNDSSTLIETREQSFAWVIAAFEWPPASLCACPGNVVGALSVTGLATNADLGPGCCVAVVCRIVVLA